jgi:hypothetical protein
MADDPAFPDSEKPAPAQPSFDPILHSVTGEPLPIPLPGDEAETAAPDRVLVRGTKDNAAAEAELRDWEKDVRADAAANGGMVPPKTSRRSLNTSVRLHRNPAPHAAVSDTETELNGLIAECRYLIREIACASARLSYDPDDRIRFLSSAQSMALTAAKIGKTVAGLRAAGNSGAVETHRHELVYTHVHTTPSPLPPEADSEKQ